MECNFVRPEENGGKRQRQCRLIDKYVTRMIIENYKEVT